MTSETDMQPKVERSGAGSRTRPFYWSVRREVWENRSIVVAPIVIGAVAMFAFVMSTIGLPHRRKALMLLGEAQRRAGIVKPFDAVGVALFAAAIGVALFYCLEALNSERRDRSILFWKSMPVSDRTAVLAKVVVPLLVIPSIAIVTTVVIQLWMLFWSTLVLAPSGLAGSTWLYVNPVRESVFLMYGYVVMSLWYAPIYAWFLLASAWARRFAVIWALVPVFLMGLLEHMVFNTSVWPFAMKYRLFGWFDEAFDMGPDGGVTSLQQLAPLRFLGTPSLWIGLAFAAVFVTVAIRLRRDRGPI